MARIGFRKDDDLETRSENFDRGIPISEWIPIFGKKSKSGYKVTRDSVEAIPAVVRAITLVSGNIANLPLNIFSKGTDNGRKLEKDHPLFYFINKRPSAFFSKIDFLQVVVQDKLLAGNSYWYIDRQNSVYPQDLTRLNPDNVKVILVIDTNTGKRSLIYQYTDTEDSNKVKTYRQDQILHFKNNIQDGLKGKSAIDSMRDTFGLAGSLQDHAAITFSNYALPGMIFQFEGKYKSKEEREKFEKSLQESYAGLQAGRPMVLPMNSVVQTISFNPEQTQLLESRKFTLIEIANAIGISAQRLGAEINTSYGSLLAERLGNLDDLELHLPSIEEELNYKCLTTEEYRTGNVYIEFDRSTMQKSDPETEEKIWIMRLTNGTATLNQYFAARNLPKGEFPEADWHLIPNNLRFIEEPKEEPKINPVLPDNSQDPEDSQDPPQDPPQDTPNPVEDRYKTLVSNQVDRMVIRFKKAIEGKYDKEGFSTWLDSEEFLHHRNIFAEALPFAESQIDDFLEPIVSELKAVLPEQVPNVLSRIDTTGLKEKLWTI